MAESIIVKSGGGGVSSDEVTVTANHVLAGQTYVGADTNDEIGTGTMAVQSAISFSCATLSSTSIRISWTNPSRGPWEGVFIQMSTSGYPGTSGGSRVYTGVGNNPVAGASNYVDITGLDVTTMYYFTCTSYVNALGWGTSYNLSAKTGGLLLYSYGSNTYSWYCYNSQFVTVTFNSDNVHAKPAVLQTSKSINLSGYNRFCMIVKPVLGNTAQTPIIQLDVDSVGNYKTFSEVDGKTIVNSNTYTLKFNISSYNVTSSSFFRFTLNTNSSTKITSAYFYKIWLE